MSFCGAILALKNRTTRNMRGYFEEYGKVVR